MVEIFSKNSNLTDGRLIYYNTFGVIHHLICGSSPSTISKMMFLTIEDGRNILLFVRGRIFESGGMKFDRDVLNKLKNKVMSFGRNCLL